MKTRRDALGTMGLGLAGIVAGCSKDGSAVSDSGGVDSSSPVDTGEPIDTVDTAPPIDTGERISCTPGTDERETCSETPERGEGPYYVEGSPERVNINPNDEDGDRLRVTCRVTDLACVPLAGVLVQFWHCAPEGAYDMESAEMRFRGHATTDADGWFCFETLRPPNYPDEADPTHILPQHIHAKIDHAGYQARTFQLKFADDPYLDDGDDRVVVTPEEGDDGWLEATWYFGLVPE